MSYFQSFFRLLRLIIWLFIVVCVVVFSASNREDVLISLYPFPWEVALPLFLLLIFCTGIGFLWGYMQARIGNLQSRMEIRRQKKRIDSLEETNTALELENRKVERNEPEFSGPALTSRES